MVPQTRSDLTVPLHMEHVKDVYERALASPRDEIGMNPSGGMKQKSKCGREW